MDWPIRREKSRNVQFVDREWRRSWLCEDLHINTWVGSIDGLGLVGSCRIESEFFVFFRVGFG